MNISYLEPKCTRNPYFKRNDFGCVVVSHFEMAPRITNHHWWTVAVSCFHVVFILNILTIIPIELVSFSLRDPRTSYFINKTYQNFSFNPHHFH